MRERIVLGTEFKFTPNDFLLSLRFSTHGFDEMVNEITVAECGNRATERRGRYIANRLVEDERGQGKNGACFWWMDGDATPMVLNNKVVGEVLSEM